MSRDNQLKERWEQLDILSNQFSQGRRPRDASFIWLGSKNSEKYIVNTKKTKIKPNAYCDLPIIRALRILWIEFLMKTVGRIQCQRGVANT
jgi:hypothetical protein